MADVKEKIVTKPENEEISSESSIKVLVADDDRISRMMMEEHISELGYDVVSVSDGKAAYDLLEQDYSQIDIAVLDREMPGMNGMEMVKRMNVHPDMKRIPVIMATGSDQPEQIREGIDVGVFYYLTKPIDQDVLKSVFLSAIRELDKKNIFKEELKKHKSSFGLIYTASFYVRTIDDAEDLAAFLANCYPDPERVITGLAELIINGIEHGNFGITYDEKTELIERDMWRHEIQSRSRLPENADKKVHVSFSRDDEALYVKIEDQGTGFDWKRYLEIDPARAKDNHGRGIAQARALSFHELQYNAAGNVVVAILRQEKELEW